MLLTIAATTERKLKMFINVQNRQERMKQRLIEWKEKALDGQFLRETENTDDRNRREWLKRGELRRETESLLCVAQEQALRVNAIKNSIYKTSDTPLCRLCNEKTESMTHIVSACSILAKSQYRKRHDKVGTYVHWLLCKKYHLQCSDKWYTYTHHNQSWKMTNIRSLRISLFKQIRYRAHATRQFLSTSKKQSVRLLVLQFLVTKT